MIKNEIKRAIFTKKFWFLVIIGVLFLFYTSYRETWNIIFDSGKDITSDDLESLKDIYCNSTVVWREGFLFYKDFYPFFVVIPFLYSYTAEKINKSANIMMIRAGKKKYYASKFLVTGISGSLVIMIPEIIYTIIVYSVFRNTPVPSWALYGKFSFLGTELNLGIMEKVIIILLVHAVLLFSYCIFAMGLSSIFKNRVGVYLGVYLIYLFVEIILSCSEFTSKYMSMPIYWLGHVDVDLARSMIIMLGMIITGVVVFTINEKVESK